MKWLRTIWLGVLLTSLVCLCAPVSAQDDPTMNDLLEQIGEEREAFDKSRVGPSSLSQVNLKVHWKLWKRVYGSGQPGADELAALRDDGRSVGWVSQPEYAMAVAALAAGQTDHEVALAMFEGAEELAPQLPYPWLLHSSYALKADIADLPEWGRAWWAGTTRLVTWPDTSFPWALKLLVYLLVALAAASLLFVFGQLLRNFPIAAYDLARLMPQGFSSNQTAVILVALVVVPGLVLRSPIVSVLLLLAAVSFVQRANERWVSVIVFAIVASLSFVDAGLARLTSYPDSTTQQMVQAQWVQCGAACQEGLKAAAGERPDDQYLRYTTLLAAYRRGGDANMSRIVEEVDAIDWSGDLIGYAHNMKGAAHIALAKPKKGLPLLEKARDEIRDSPAPAFNLMRAHQMLDDAEAASAALREASSRDFEVVTAYLGLERRDTNSFLIVEPLPLSGFWGYHFSREEPGISPIGSFWDLLGGDVISLEASRYVGLAGMVLVLLGFPLRRRTSTPCPRCGLARDPTDAQKSGHHAYCFPCYSTFVTGATLDYDARVHNEKVLGRRESLQRLMRRMFSVVAPGLGHHIGGHAGTGFAITACLAFGAAVILRPLGVIRVAAELVSRNWAGQITFAWLVVSICILIVLSVALRDIPPVGVQGEEQ